MNAEHGMHSSRKPKVCRGKLVAGAECSRGYGDGWGSGYGHNLYHSGHGKKPDASTMIFEVLDAKGKSK